MVDINDRMERIGSSMIFGICFEGGYEAYRQLVLKEATPVNDAMDRGTRFETPIMQWAADNNGWTFRPAPTIRWEKDGVPYRDTADFFATSQGSDEEILCEVKSHSPWIEDSYGEEFGMQVPERVALQAQLHCEANDKDKCRVIAHFGVERPKIYTVLRDPEMWTLIHQKCKKFWDEYVVPEVMPPSDGTDKCTNLLARIAQTDDVVLTAGDLDADKDARLEEVKAQIKVLAVEKELIGNWFRERIGASVGIQGQEFRYTHKANRPRQIVDYQGLVSELAPDPELVEKYTTTKEGARVLRRSKPKGVNNG